MTSAFRMALSWKSAQIIMEIRLGILTLMFLELQIQNEDIEKSFM